MGTAVAFARGLSNSFFMELESGRFSKLLSEVKGKRLDVQIREHYVDVYANGRGVLNLLQRGMQSQYRARIHQKYLCDLLLPSLEWQDRNYQYFDATDAFIAEYLANLTVIIMNSQQCAKRRDGEADERTVEQEMIRASHGASSPVVFIDRQVQMHGATRKLDLVGLVSDPAEKTRALLVELKLGLDNRIQYLVNQMTRYQRVFAPDGRLHPQVAESYRKVTAQKKRLGLLPSSATFPAGDIVTEALVVLANYTRKSRLLDRLRAQARESGFRAKLVLLEQGIYELPPMDCWEAL
jgi:hypothetical protein